MSGDIHVSSSLFETIYVYFIFDSYPYMICSIHITNNRYKFFPISNIHMRIHICYLNYIVNNMSESVCSPTIWIRFMCVSHTYYKRINFALTREKDIEFLRDKTLNSLNMRD